MSYKIEALVKFNVRIAVVLDKCPVITYERHGNFLLGLDEYWVFVRYRRRYGYTNEVILVDMAMNNW